MDPQLIEWMEKQNDIVTNILMQIHILQEQIDQINETIRVIKLTNWM